MKSCELVDEAVQFEVTSVAWLAQSLTRLFYNNNSCILVCVVKLEYVSC